MKKIAVLFFTCTSVLATDIIPNAASVGNIGNAGAYFAGVFATNHYGSNFYGLTFSGNAATATSLGSAAPYTTTNSVAYQIANSNLTTPLLVAQQISTNKLLTGMTNAAGQALGTAAFVPISFFTLETNAQNYASGVGTALTVNGLIGGTNIVVSINSSNVANLLVVTNGSTVGVNGTLYVATAATVAGTLTATTFSGSGASLTALPAAQLTGNPPSPFVTNNGAQTFTGVQTFSSAPVMSGASITAATVQYGALPIWPLTNFSKVAWTNLNTADIATNTAPVRWVNTAIVPGAKTTGPAQQFQVTLTFYNTGPAATNVVFVWSNAVSAIVTSNIFTMTGNQTSSFTGPIMSPGSVFYLTNQNATAGVGVVGNSTVLSAF